MEIIVLLSLENEQIPMKVVFLLSEKLIMNPERVVLTQALTLNSSKPMLGIKGVHGLLGSQKWWENGYAGWLYK